MKLYESSGETSASIAYSKYCDLFGWDKTKSNRFAGKDTPLYAPNADSSRKLGVWFVSYSNLSEQNPDKEPNWINTFEGKNNELLHLTYMGGMLKKKMKIRMDGFSGEDINHDDRGDRIVFAKEMNGEYKFYGIYSILKEPNLYLRTYKRTGTEL
jgi:hypothetical protein